MTRVVALVAFSTGAITMEEKSVYEVDDALATNLIAQGLCADAATYFGGGGSGGGSIEIVKCVAGSPNTCDHTYAQLKAAYEAGKVLYCDSLYQGQHLCGILSYEENQYVGYFVVYVRVMAASAMIQTKIAKDDSVTIASV